MRDFEHIQPADIYTAATPEQLLWLAVIDRALVDYVKWLPSLTGKNKSSVEWFLFHEEPQPYNLAFLSEQLFDDDTVIIKIRKRAVALAKGFLSIDEIDSFKKRRYNLRVKSRFF